MKYSDILKKEIEYKEKIYNGKKENYEELLLKYYFYLFVEDLFLN